jgi:hypothetical protein
MRQLFTEFLFPGLTFPLSLFPRWQNRDSTILLRPRISQTILTFNLSFKADESASPTGASYCQEQLSAVSTSLLPTLRTAACRITLFSLHLLVWTVRPAHWLRNVTRVCANDKKCQPYEVGFLSPSFHIGYSG